MKIKITIKTKLLIIFFFVSQVFGWVALHSSAVGESLALSETQTLAIKLQQENEELKRQIAVSSSLASIRQRANELGLVSLKKTIILREGEMFARCPAEESTF